MTTGGGAYARNTDPTTSQEAANSLSDGCLTALQKIVVDILKAHSSGLTVPEIAAIADRTVVTISPRIRPLVNAGVIHNSGTKKIPPEHTRACIVWAFGRNHEVTETET